jgi:zinc D-Ala-D-Ala dipeptidase
MKMKLFAVILAAALLCACGKAAESVSVSSSAVETAASVSASSVVEVAASSISQVQKAYNLPDGFVYVDDVIPDVVLEMRYATAHNFTGAPMDGYNAEVCILTKEAADALKIAAQKFAADGWRIHIYDTYRPQAALDYIIAWGDSDDEACREEFYPTLTKAQLFTDGYLSKRSRHTRGSTVDMTLEDKDGTLIDVGGPYDLLDPLSNFDTPDITEEQRKNRYYIQAIMTEAGFDTIPTEWWHYQLRNEPYPDTYFDFPVE